MDEIRPERSPKTRAGKAQARRFREGCLKPLHERSEVVLDLAEVFELNVGSYMEWEFAKPLAKFGLRISAVRPALPNPEPSLTIYRRRSALRRP